MLWTRNEMLGGESWVFCPWGSSWLWGRVQKFHGSVENPFPKGVGSPGRLQDVQERGGRDGKLNPDKEEWAQLIPLAQGRVWELVGLSLA